MKINLAENMLRFGPKNLTEASKQKLAQLAEQTQKPQTKPTNQVAAPPAQPQQLKSYLDASIDSSTLFWTGGGSAKKSIATINVIPSSDNKYYTISGVNFKNAKGQNPYIFKFTKALTFTVGQDDGLIMKWRPLIVESLKNTDINALFMYMNFPGGMTQSSGGNTRGLSLDNPDATAIDLASAIYNGLVDLKLAK